SKFLSLHRDRTLQALQNHHRSATRAAVGDFRTSQGRISLGGRTLSIRLMANLTVCGEYFFAALDRRQLGLGSGTLCASAFFCHGRAGIRIEAVATEAP